MRQRQQPFIIYDRSTGAILTRLLADPDIQELGEGQRVLVLDQDAWAAIHDPSEEAQERLAAGVRVALWERVKGLRALHRLAGVETAYGPVPCDPDTMALLRGKLAVAQAVGEEWSFEFTFQNDETAQLDSAALAEVVLAADARDQQIHEHSQALRAALDEADDATAMLRLDIERGWVG